MAKSFPSEGVIVSQCIKWLLLHGCFVHRNNTGAYKPEGSKRYIRYGYKGSPDILGINPAGKFIGVECKTGYNKLSEAQVNYQKEILGRGGHFVVAYSVDDLEAIKQKILK